MAQSDNHLNTPTHTDLLSFRIITYCIHSLADD